MFTLVVKHQTIKTLKNKRDNADMTSLLQYLKDTCSTFSDNTPVELVNLASGNRAMDDTMSCLIHILQRGRNFRYEFQN